MFCENCGAQLRDDARFCPNCGAPVDEEVFPQATVEPHVSTDDATNEKAQELLNSILEKSSNAKENEIFQGWKLTNNLFEISPVEINMPGNMILDMIDGKIEFVCLTPPNQINGSNYMQAAMCEDGTIHFEVCMEKDGGGYLILAKDDAGTAHACHYMATYMTMGIIPYDIDKWYRI